VGRGSWELGSGNWSPAEISLKSAYVACAIVLTRLQNWGFCLNANGQ